MKPLEQRMTVDRDRIRNELRERFELHLEDQVDRQARSRVHPFIPAQFFSVASSECRSLFVEGHFYGCITLAQSVAEGIARFLAQKNELGEHDNYRSQINILQRDRSNPVISPVAFAAFRAIHGKDRNDFHHLNPQIEQDRKRLECRAEECLNALYAIESEVFGYMLAGEHGVILHHPQYWPPAGADSVVLHIRPS